jgi:hypothetical protein
VLQPLRKVDGDEIREIVGRQHKAVIDTAAINTDHLALAVDATSVGEAGPGT